LAGTVDGWDKSEIGIIWTFKKVGGVAENEADYVGKKNPNVVLL